MSELYTKIILNVILRNIQKRPEYEYISSLSRFHALPDSLQQPWSLLCKLAFETFCEDKIVFSHEELDVVLPLDSKVACFGLLHSAESILVDGHGVSFHFLHLTFQEYLDALHLVRQPTDTQLQLCQSYARSEHFEMVWRFFFGISFTICNQPIDTKVLKVLFDEINYHRHRGITPLCHFAFEASHGSMDVLDIVASIVKTGCPPFRFEAYTSFDFAAIAYVIANLQDCKYRSLALHLGSCGISDKQIMELADALTGGHKKLQVRSIILYGNNLSDQSVGHLFDRALPAFSQSLKYINVGKNVIGPKAINSIATVLAESSLVGAIDLPQVVDMRICDTPLKLEGLQVLRDAIYAKKLSCLETLFLNGSLTDDADANGQLILALGSGHCRRLNWLNLSRNKLGVPGGKALGKVLPHLRAPVSLHLKKVMLGDGGISALIQNLEGVCKLQILELENNGIHATGISCLAESICAGTILILYWLNLSNNPLGLGGAMAAVRILSSEHSRGSHTELSESQLASARGNVSISDFSVAAKQLICSQLLLHDDYKDFEIDRNNFSGEGIQVIAAFMLVCPSLSYLNCQYCGITSDDLKQLLVLLSDQKIKFQNLDWWNLNHNDIDDD